MSQAKTDKKQQVERANLEWRVEDRRKLLVQCINNAKDRIEENAKFLERAAKDLRGRLDFCLVDPKGDINDPMVMDSLAKRTVSSVQSAASFLGGGIMSNLRFDMMVVDTEAIVRARMNYEKALADLERFNEI